MLIGRRNWAWSNSQEWEDQPIREMSIEWQSESGQILLTGQERTPGFGRPDTGYAYRIAISPTELCEVLQVAADAASKRPESFALTKSGTQALVRLLAASAGFRTDEVRPEP